VSAPRPHPFALVFGDMAAERFPAVRDALQGNLDIEHFLMTPAAVELLHELRPEEGLGDAVDDFVSFVHAAFCYWHDGGRTIAVDEDRVRKMLEGGGSRVEGGEDSLSSTLHPLPSRYVQLPPRLLWSQVESSEIHEPLDGWFVVPQGDARRVVACLGLHAERPGLSVLVATGTEPLTLAREDGTAPFAPLMEGGAAAGLHSVADADELLWLACWSEKQEARSEN
jgi:hypothetical protein